LVETTWSAAGNSSTLYGRISSPQRPRPRRCQSGARRNDVGPQWVSQFEDPSPADLETVSHEQAADGHLHLGVMRHRSCNTSGSRRYDLSVTRRSRIGINDNQKVACRFVVIPTPGEEIRMILDSDDIQSAFEQ
jgi:hypothetical protein